MELLAKRQRPVLLRRSVLRCTRSTSGASFLQDALQRHGMEFRLFRRYLFDTRRIDRRIRLRHPEEVHIVILFVHVAILLIYRGKQQENLYNQEDPNRWNAITSCLIYIWNSNSFKFVHNQKDQTAVMSFVKAWKIQVNTLSNVEIATPKVDIWLERNSISLFIMSDYT